MMAALSYILRFLSRLLYGIIGDTVFCWYLTSVHHIVVLYYYHVYVSIFL